MSLIYIPLQRSEEHVALPVDQLAATDPIDLIRMLVRERVPLEIWLRVAVRFHFAPPYGYPLPDWSQTSLIFHQSLLQGFDWSPVEVVSALGAFSTFFPCGGVIISAI